MSENFEMKQGLLEQFRIEIKRIINTIGSKDATIGSVTSPDALGDNELVLWQDFKNILQRTRALPQQDSIVVENELGQIYQSCVALDKKIQENIKNAERVNNDSAIYFGAWLNNKNPLSKIQSAQRICGETGTEKALAHLEQRMKQISELCLGS